jgi:hypothetical protein
MSPSRSHRPSVMPATTSRDAVRSPTGLGVPQLVKEPPATPVQRRTHDEPATHSPRRLHQHRRTSDEARPRLREHRPGRLRPPRGRQPRDAPRCGVCADAWLPGQATVFRCELRQEPAGEATLSARRLWTAVTASRRLRLRIVEAFASALKCRRLGEDQCLMSAIGRFLVQALRSVDALQKANCYTQGLIIVYSAVDTLAWLGCDEKKRDVDRESFITWVDRFMLPNSALQCNATDLYAARCGLVHNHAASRV